MMNEVSHRDPINYSKRLIWRKWSFQLIGPKSIVVKHQHYFRCLKSTYYHAYLFMHLGSKYSFRQKYIFNILEYDLPILRHKCYIIFP